MILYVLLCIVLVFFLFKKEGFKEGAEPAEPAEPVNDIQQLKDTISKIDERLTKIEKDISDFQNA